MTDPLASNGLPDTLAERLAHALPRLRAHLARRQSPPGIDNEDLAQEVLARALRYRKRFDPTRALWPWLRRLADRVWLDQHAADARRPNSLGEHEPLAPENEAALDERDEVERLVASLPERERAVLLRFHRDGQSIQAIAIEMNLPAGTVKSHLSRARRRLAGPPEEPSHG